MFFSRMKVLQIFKDNLLYGRKTLNENDGTLPI